MMGNNRIPGKHLAFQRKAYLLRNHQTWLDLLKLFYISKMKDWWLSNQVFCYVNKGKGHGKTQMSL